MNLNERITDHFNVKSTNGSFVTLCPIHDDKEPSLSIKLLDDKNPLVNCLAGCESEDVIEYFKQNDLWIIKKPTSHDKSLHQAVWDSSQNLTTESLASLYLNKRGLIVAAEYPSLRYNPHCFYQQGVHHPALILKIEKDGLFQGIQRIFLTETGSKLGVKDNKKILGESGGGHCQLGTPPDKVLHIAEGLETALSIYQSLNEPTCAAISATNLSKIHIAKTVETLHFWADKDVSETGLREASKAANNFASQGYNCIIHIPELPVPDGLKGIDFLDVLNISGEEKIREERNKGEIINARKLSPFVLPHHDLPLIDESYMPAPIWKWGQQNSKRLSVPSEMIFVPFLSVTGSLIGRKRGVKMKKEDTHVENPNLWGLVICPPSSKKSPSLGISTAKITKIEQEGLQKQDEALKQYVAKCIRIDQQIKDLQANFKNSKKAGHLSAELIESKILKLNQEKEDLKPKARRLLLQSSTIEKMVNVVKDNPNGLLVLRDEIFGLFETFGKKGSEGSRQFYLESWNGNASYSHDTISRGTQFIPHLCATLLGSAQPSKVNQIVKNLRDNRENDGFLQRFQLMVFPNQFGDGSFVDSLSDPESEKFIENFFRYVIDIPPNEIPVSISDEAYAIYSAFFDKLGREATSCTDEAFSGHLGKYHKLFSGIALIFYVVEGYINGKFAEKIERHLIEMAVKWTNLFKAHAAKVYNYNLHSNGVKGQQLAIRIKNGEIKNGANLRSIYRHKWTLLNTPDDVLEAVNYLEELGWLQLVEEKPPFGRPSEILKFHPNLENFIRSPESAL